MNPETIQLLNNPIIIIGIVVVTGYFVLRSFGKSLNHNSQANLLMVEQATKITTVATDALKELTEKTGRTIQEITAEVKAHNEESAAFRERELQIQKQIADTLARLTAASDVQTNALATQSETIQTQTKLMKSMVAIMENMSESDVEVKAVIEERIAPSIDALKNMMENIHPDIIDLKQMTDHLSMKLKNFNPDEITESLTLIRENMERLIATINRVIQNINQPPPTDQPKTDGGTS